MAALAFRIDELMAAGDTQKIIDAISNLKDSFSVSLNAVSVNVAGLDVKVQTMGVQISALAQEVKDKASRNELSSVKESIEKELSRVEDGVSKDAEGFQQMYESVVGEIREMRQTLTSMDERLRKLEPLELKASRAEGFFDGTQWIIRAVWAIIGGAAAATVLKLVSGK